MDGFVENIVEEEMDVETDVLVKNIVEEEVAVETKDSHGMKQEHDGHLAAEAGEKRWPGWPGQSVFRVLVPAYKVGSLIGPKGEFIKRMCKESKAHIKILGRRTELPERVVMISAKEELDASISPAMDGLLRVHKWVIYGLDGESGHAALGTDNTVPTRLLVPATQAESLVGKQGAIIKSIQEASNSVVQILDNLPPVALLNDRVVEIQGEPSAMHKAVELIAKHLRKFLVDLSVLPLFENYLPRPETPQSWGHPQGLAPNGGGSSYGGNPQFMPPWLQDNFHPLPDRWEKQPHHDLPTYGQNATPIPMGIHSAANQQAPRMISQVTQHMQIPLSYAAAVVGEAGASISYIRRASGAIITVRETRGVPGEMTVEITGSATQVQTAQQFIQNFMAAAPAPSQDTMSGL